MKLKLVHFLTLATVLLCMAVLLSSCKDGKETAAERADAENKAAQNDVKARATGAVPVPNITNFQSRRNLSEFMDRLDERNKIWYVYERARDTGKILGVWVSSSYPQSVCTFMTPPEEIKQHDGWAKGEYGVSVSTAMALDGVYYKGGDCPDFFFDYNTGALVVLDSDAVTIAVDKPLDTNAPQINFNEDEEE